MDRDFPRKTRSIGPVILIPGCPQWSWHQRDRAYVLFGSYIAAILVAILTWGTTTGLFVLGFAFATHVFSAVDAIRQNAFPGFGWTVPTLTASAGLGVTFYAPVLALASVYAWPVTIEDPSRDAYLVNRWAYRGQSPRGGEMVWLRQRHTPRPRLGRVVATSGQRVEWVGGEFRVDDHATEFPPFSLPGSPGELKLSIPEGHVLVDYTADDGRRIAAAGGWEIVESGEIRGRAWARSYPFWDRRLLR